LPRPAFDPKRHGTDFIYVFLSFLLCVFCVKAFVLLHGKEARQARFHASWAVEGRNERLPLYRGSGKVAPVGENVFGLQACALKDKIREADVRTLYVA
jgi:hypothetical protein